MKTKNKDITILVIEDDSTMNEGIQTVLRKEGFTVLAAEDGITGSTVFRENDPDLVITDLKLPGKSGMALLNEFLKTKPSLPVILISAFGTIDLAVSALKSGARDFIAKPFSIDELRLKVNQIVDKQLEPSCKSGTTGPSFHGMVGASSIIKEIFTQIKQIAQVDSTVLITGESGTGKELVARALHRESKRKNNPYLAVNCGAFTETLLASELFGHEKGAFTDANKQHKGIFEQADGGTILLDEVGEISPLMQVKLLRILQNQSFQRVGGTKDITTDVRIIASTNKDLKQAIQQNNFREDLYFRLNVIPLHIPPLRERFEDISSLIRYIMLNKARQLGKVQPEFSEKAIQKLQSYAWPGNIRELENFLERLLIFNKKDIIAEKDIFFENDGALSGRGTGSLTRTLEETEYKMITEALQKSGGIKQRAAKLLGIKTSTLYYKMEKYEIDL